MNEMLRRDVPGFDHAAPTLRSTQVRVACQAYLAGEASTARRRVREEPTIAVVEARPRVAPVSSPIAPPAPGATLLETMAREVTAALVLGLLGVARRAAGSRRS